MKAEIVNRDGKVLSVYGHTIAISPNGQGPVMIRAELDEGDSPISILIGGNQRHPERVIPIKHLQIVNKQMIKVKKHTRHYKSGPVVVKEHWMHKPRRHASNGDHP